MKTFRSCGAALAIAALVSALPAAAQPRPVEAEDLFKIAFLESAQISPDGAHVAVVRSHMNGPKNTYESTVLLVDVANGATTDVTRGTHDGDIAWAPDSKSLYFVRADKKKHPQIFRYELKGGAVKQLTSIKDSASGPTPSHDGRRVAFTVTETDPSHATYVDFAKAGFKPAEDEQKTDIRAIDTMGFEVNGAGYVYDKHAHIWVMNADGTGAHALTSGK